MKHEKFPIADVAMLGWVGQCDVRPMFNGNALCQITDHLENTQYFGGAISQISGTFD